MKLLGFSALLFLVSVLGLFGLLWYGVLIHLSGWGLALGLIALFERVFRIIRFHFRVGGRNWIEM